MVKHRQVARVGHKGQGRRRRLLLALLILVIAIFGRTTVYADGDSVSLMVGRSTVVNTGSPIARVSLTSADVADAMVTSANELLINGKMPGTISLFVWDRSGGIRRYEVNVQRDLGRLSEQLQTLFPGESIAAQSNGKSIVLAGSVSHKDVIDRAINVAAGYVDKKDEVVSLLQVRDVGMSNQVMLRVRFAEVSRNALTQLGATFYSDGGQNTIGSLGTGQFPTPFFDQNKAMVGDHQVFSDYLNLFLFDFKHQIGAVIKALQTKGLFQSLAEPNLVAESGKEASFLAGGEFPIPIAQSSGASLAISIQFKEFGIRLSFTPTVTGDRIHLKVRPEVSTLDFNNALLLQGFRIPALSTRRAETELELMNGQTFAIAGLLSNTVATSMQKVPGLGDIPILGKLFQSKAAQKEQTELVVIISPEILPRNSHGVTSTLPKMIEPFMAPPPAKKLMDMPPPAFKAPAPAAPAPRSGSNDTSPNVVAVAQSAPAASPNEAARIVQELTPKTSTVVIDKPAEAPAPKPQAAPAVQVPDPQPMARKDAEARKNEEERKRQDKLAREQAKEAQATAKRQAEIDKAANDAAAKRAAEQAKKQAEIDRKQAEIDKKQQKAIEDAQAKVKAAEAAYQSELGKKSSKQF